MQWIVHGERILYDSAWVRLALADIEIPGGARFDHHVVRSTRHAAGTVVTDPDRGVLLLWRHRFITQTWGWEVPAGAIDHGETPVQAAERETLEETGWRPGPLTHLTSYYPNNGQADVTFHVFRADGATYEGPPADPSESERIEWRSWSAVREQIATGTVTDGLSLTALLYVLMRR